MLNKRSLRRLQRPGRNIPAVRANSYKVHNKLSSILLDLLTRSNEISNGQASLPNWCVAKVVQGLGRKVLIEFSGLDPSRVLILIQVIDNAFWEPRQAFFFFVCFFCSTKRENFCYARRPSVFVFVWIQINGFFSTSKLSLNTNVSLSIVYFPDLRVSVIDIGSLLPIKIYIESIKRPLSKWGSKSLGRRSLTSNSNFSHQKWVIVSSTFFVRHGRARTHAIVKLRRYLPVYVIHIPYFSPSPPRADACWHKIPGHVHRAYIRSHRSSLFMNFTDTIHGMEVRTFYS
jgi:hypothetical protein